MKKGASQLLEQQMLKPSMSFEDEQIREALSTHWHASAVGDANPETIVHSPIGF
jgi:hypothetical protein